VLRLLLICSPRSTSKIHPSSGVESNSANALNGFIHGSWHSDLKRPFRLSAWLTNNARLVLHVNSVSDAVDLHVLADGALLYRTSLPNLDGTCQVNNEYNLDIAVNVPAGKHRLELTNAGGDWVFLDWVRLENVLPSDYPGGWQPSPESIGLRGPHESLLYVVAPNASYPSEATNTLLSLRQGARHALGDHDPYVVQALACPDAYAQILKSGLHTQGLWSAWNSPLGNDAARRAVFIPRADVRQRNFSVPRSGSVIYATPIPGGHWSLLHEVKPRRPDKRARPEPGSLDSDQRRPAIPKPARTSP
jgi:hypothetical protein